MMEGGRECKKMERGKEGGRGRKREEGRECRRMERGKEGGRKREEGREWKEVGRRGTKRKEGICSKCQSEQGHPLTAESSPTMWEEW